MSAPLTSAPRTFVPAISQEVPWHTRQHIELLYQKLASNALAITKVHAGVQNITNTTIQEAAGGGVTPAAPTFPGLGAIDDQTGNTAYTLTTNDNGIFLIVNDASPVAITLSAAMTTPYFFFASNWGAGAVTYTPTSGTINGAASWVQQQGGLFLIAFDGTNWKTSDVLVLAQTFAAVTHEFLTAYDAVTGLFTAAQPVIADVTGLTAALAALAPKASPTFSGTVTQPDATVLTAATTTTSATAGAGSALPATPEGYLSASINGTIFKVPYYPV
jgi:hypothetical protein